MKIIFTFSFLLATVLLFAQVTPPANVLARFNAEYPEHQKEVWNSPAKNIYVVKFFLGMKGHVVKYDVEAKWWEKQYEVTYNELTPPIKASLAKIYSPTLIDSVSKIEKRDKTVWYWVFFNLPPKSTDNPSLQCRRLGLNYSADGKGGMVVNTNCRAGK